MKKNWKKTVSVLLLTALLCALPGAVSWAEGTTDVNAITPDGPTVNQPGGESGTSTGGTSGTSGTDTSGSTGTTETSGTDTSGSTGTSGTSGTDTSGSTGTSGTSGTDTSGSTGTTGTSGTDTSGSGTTAGQGGTTDTTGDSTTSGTTGGQTSSDSSLNPAIVVEGSVVTPSDTATTPAQPSVPEAAPTSTPTPAPTPSTAPTATPVATPTPTPSLPVVTKDPTDETVDAGGDCWFIANYSNAKYAVWHFVSPDGKTNYRYNDPAVATAFPGLKIENGDQSNLHLSSIPTQMNGWGSYCEYSNETGSVRTNAAVVHVNGAPAATPTPSPSATPTPTPTPSATPTPAATPTAAPSPSPAVSPSPAASPTPEGSGEAPSALNHGGRIFLLFGALTLIVGAAAIAGILFFSKRAQEKEAYNYRRGSRRR